MCCRTSSLYLFISSCPQPQLLPDSTNVHIHTEHIASASSTFPHVQIKRFLPRVPPLSTQCCAVKPKSANALRSSNSYTPWQASTIVLAVPSLSTALHTCCPHPQPRAKESSCVGRVLAPNRLALRWLHPSIHSPMGLVCVLSMTSYL